MGGNVFEDTRRLTPEQHETTVKKVIASIRSVDPGINVAAPPELLDKESFCDVDIIVGKGLDDGDAEHNAASKSNETEEAIVGAVCRAVRGGGSSTSGDEENVTPPPLATLSTNMYHILLEEGFQIDLQFIAS